MDERKKRKADCSANDAVAEKKIKKQWRTSRPAKPGGSSQSQTIEPGDAGIWATCDRGKESKCMSELKDLFEEYVESLYRGEIGPARNDKNGEIPHDDIEGEIKKEVDAMFQPNSASLFTPMRVDVQCVVFFKTRYPIEPVSFVHAICQDASQNPSLKRTRFVRRLTPITMITKATQRGLEELAGAFAIRPSLRNHSTLTRDEIIKQVASAVGGSHTVDLKGFDRLVLVEVFKNTCGMSVVGHDYDTLKRFNLAELYQPVLM